MHGLLFAWGGPGSCRMQRQRAISLQLRKVTKGTRTGCASEKCMAVTHTRLARASEAAGAYKKIKESGAGITAKQESSAGHLDLPRGRSSAKLHCSRTRRSVSRHPLQTNLCADLCIPGRSKEGMRSAQWETQHLRRNHGIRPDGIVMRENRRTVSRNMHKNKSLLW